MLHVRKWGESTRWSCAQVRGKSGKVVWASQILHVFQIFDQHFTIFQLFTIFEISILWVCSFSDPSGMPLGRGLGRYSAALRNLRGSCFLGLCFTFFLKQKCQNTAHLYPWRFTRIFVVHAWCLVVFRSYTCWCHQQGCFVPTANQMSDEMEYWMSTEETVKSEMSTRNYAKVTLKW